MHPSSFVGFAEELVAPQHLISLGILYVSKSFGLFELRYSHFSVADGSV